MKLLAATLILMVSVLFAACSRPNPKIVAVAGPNRTVRIQIENRSHESIFVPAHSDRLMCTVVARDGQATKELEYPDFIRMRAIQATWSPDRREIKPGQRVTLKVPLDSLRIAQSDRDRSGGREVPAIELKGNTLYCVFDVDNDTEK